MASAGTTDRPDVTEAAGNRSARPPLRIDSESEAFFRDFGSAVGVSNPASMRLQSTETDSIGYTHLTYRQYHGDVPVFGAMVKTHFGRNGRLLEVAGTAIPDISVSTTPAVSREQAGAVARAAVVADRGNSDLIQPRGSTRMGTALRHAIGKMRDVRAPNRYLMLISDGFPQDLDYGDDRRSHAYGIGDTAVALREVESAGIKPFCITVDVAGHDYLRRMSDPLRYMIIENVEDLPRQLPKIYQRLVRAA